VALCADTGVTFFGAGAAFFANCLKAGVDLSTLPGLKTVRALGTTGSPLSRRGAAVGHGAVPCAGDG
jgi:acetoacetyl-CoA synthetase